MLSVYRKESNSFRLTIQKRFMNYFDRHSRQFRVIVVILISMLCGIAFVNFSNFAGSPTDENLFIDSPSNLYITHDFPASVLSDSVGKVQGKESPSSSAADHIKRGDLLVALNGQFVQSATDYEKTFSWMKDSSDVTLYVYRPATNERLTFRTIKKAIPDSNFIQLPFRIACVIDITPGGASDRAGMKRGDLIYRINGKGFSNSIEADQILRSGKSGKTIIYDIYRDGETIPLRVTLARIGIPVQVLPFIIAGLFYLAFGAFIGFRRPELVAARLLGLSFIFIGYFITVAIIQRDPGITLFGTVRNVLAVFCVFFGMAVMIHSTVHYPTGRQYLLSNRWRLRIIYGMAALDFVLIIIFKSPIVYLGLLVSLLYWMSIQWKCRKYRTEEFRKLNRIIKWTSTGVLILCSGIGTIIGVMEKQQLVGWIGILLMFIPLAYLYTIGRYRLLGLDLRVRRNVRYTLATILWGLLLASGLAWCFLTLPSVPLPLRNLVFTGSFIEVNDAPEFREQRLLTQEVLLMAIAVALTYGAYRLRLTGQKLIDRRYHRSRYDYRRAAAELSEVMTSQVGMVPLANGIVKKLAELMQLKCAAVLFFRNEKMCCCQQAYGIEGDDRGGAGLNVDENLIAIIKRYQGVFRVEDLPAAVREEFRACGYQFIVPIQSKDQLIGAILIGEKLAETTIRQDDVEYLTTAATQASVAIENAFLYEELAEKTRMQHELEIARNIQLASLPQKTPAIPGLDIAGISIPAMEVGGDFFDYLNGEAGNADKLTVIIGDVSGKGTSAALYMSRVQGILRSLHDFAPTPADLFIKANHQLCRDLEKKSFVTVFGALFDTGEKKALLARAGHLPLFLFRSATGHVIRIVPKGIGLGLDDTDVFINEIQEESVSYDSGDVFVFVTDGILEAHNLAMEEFGEERLVRIFRDQKQSSAELLRNRIIDEVHAFAGESYQHDDQTIVVVKAL